MEKNLISAAFEPTKLNIAILFPYNKAILSILLKASLRSTFTMIWLIFTTDITNISVEDILLLSKMQEIKMQKLYRDKLSY